MDRLQHIGNLALWATTGVPLSSPFDPSLSPRSLTVWYLFITGFSLFIFLMLLVSAILNARTRRIDETKRVLKTNLFHRVTYKAAGDNVVHGGFLTYLSPMRLTLFIDSPLNPQQEVIVTVKDLFEKPTTLYVTVRSCKQNGTASYIAQARIRLSTPPVRAMMREYGEAKVASRTGR